MRLTIRSVCRYLSRFPCRPISHFRFILSALTGTDPLLLMEVEPANAHEFVIRSAASSSLFDAARLHQFLCSAEGRFFVLAYVSVSAARSGGQARSGATRSHAQRSTASMARIASTGP
jgi:hypothetical protein